MGSSVFDMIGPIMIGPSSSHTAGVVRIARVAYKIMGGQADEVIVTFYNSFARTYEGHGSDRAVIAGLLDFKTDDKRIKDAFDHAKERNLSFQFKAIGNASTMHPNTIRIQMKKGDKQMEVIGQSLGGGVINISEVDGFRANFNASSHTLIVTALDVKGSIAFIADIIAHDDCNIATMSVSRKGKNDMARQFIEMDSGVKPTTLEYLKNLSWVKDVIYIPDIDL